MSLPTLAIVGRPNVGKSAIFNRLAGRRIAIVHDMPGVTRDRITADCNKLCAPITVMDTGGIGLSLDDGFGSQVETEAEIAMEAADAIAFVVDAREGISPIDAAVAAQLRRTEKPVILVVNKADTPKLDALDGEFSSLGFPIAAHVSAEHDRGFARLHKEIENVLGLKPGDGPERYDRSDHKKRPLKLALVGRPNVGKSSLINAILEDDRTIVSDVAGTTRDTVDVPYERGGRPYTLIDTAGIRRKQRAADSIEVFSVKRAEKAIRRADLCALVIDSAEGVTSQDRKIAQLIQRERKPCIVVLNKFDLFHPDASYKDRWAELAEEARPELFFLDYAPMVAVSAKEKDNLNKLFGALNKVEEGAGSGMSTGALNRFLEKVITQNPPPQKSGRRFNLLYAVWKKGVPDRPIPLGLFILFANRKGLLPNSYTRYLENKMREEFPFIGIPIHFDIRAKEKR